jgi:hypothetical protein
MNIVSRVYTSLFCCAVFLLQVRVDVHFCGVNFADILACRGQYQEKPPLPFTPGEYGGPSDCYFRKEEFRVFRATPIFSDTTPHSLPGLTSEVSVIYVTIIVRVTTS